MIVSPKRVFKQRIIRDALRENVQQNGIDIRVAEEVVLPPKSFKNILCIESVFVPHNLTGRLNIRSTYSRKGIFCSSGLWDSGFQGRLGCSLYNLSDETITIPKGERIAQIFFCSAKSASLYSGKYQGDGLEGNQKQLPIETCDHGKQLGDCGICAEGDPTKFHVQESEGPPTVK